MDQGPLLRGQHGIVGNTKFIYLAGMGTEGGPRNKIRNPGYFIEQCKR